MKRFVVGVTGASGSVCARSLLRHLARHPDVDRIHAVLSPFSLQTIRAEIGAAARDEGEGLASLLGGEESSKVTLHRSTDMAAPISSGS